MLWLFDNLCKSFSAAMLAASWREIKNQFLNAFTQFEISVGEAVCFIDLIKALPTMAPAPYWQAAAKVEAFEIPKPNIMGFFKPMRRSRSKQLTCSAENSFFKPVVLDEETA